MNKPLSKLFVLPIAALAGLAATSAVQAQDLTPPVVVQPVANVVVPVGTTQSKVKLKKTFALQGISGQVVRFTTSLGRMDVALDAVNAPLSVANFLGYVDRGNYTNSFLHRSVQNGIFIIQGGGFYIPGDDIESIPSVDPVVNESKVPNTRGTLSMARTNDPNSGTSQWFFNNQDNSAGLGNSTTTGYAVFGRVITNGEAVMDALGALLIVNAGGVFAELPVLPTYTGGQIELTDLARVNSVTRIPLISKVEGEAGLLKIKATSSNPGLVVPVVSKDKVLLQYVSGATGMATISLKAKDTAGTKVKTSFTVTVQ